MYHIFIVAALRTGILNCNRNINRKISYCDSHQHRTVSTDILICYYITFCHYHIIYIYIYMYMVRIRE